MDQRLQERLEKVADEIDALEKIEETFLALEAHKDVLYSQLLLGAEGKNVAEREARVYAGGDWIDFIVGLVAAEVAMNRARRYYQLKLKAFDAEYLTLKTETPVIRRQGA